MHAVVVFDLLLLQRNKMKQPLFSPLVSLRHCSSGHGPTRPPVPGPAGAPESHLHLHLTGPSAAASVRGPGLRAGGGGRAGGGTHVCRDAAGEDEDLRGHVHQSPQVRLCFHIFIMRCSLCSLCASVVLQCFCV